MSIWTSIKDKIVKNKFKFLTAFLIGIFPLVFVVIEYLERYGGYPSLSEKCST